MKLEIKLSMIMAIVGMGLILSSLFVEDKDLLLILGTVYTVGGEILSKIDGLKEK